jgi:hypothetical protein
MKKIYLSALSILFGAAAMAQVSVTFRVDMNGQTVSANGVHVAGNWQAAAGYPGDWQPGTAQMTDDNADGIYELNVNVPPGQYEYKFINNNDWPGVEGVPVVSQKGGGNDNRVFAVSQWHADNGGLTLPAILFGGAAPDGQVAVRLQIDMSNQTVGELGVHVAGNFSDPVWTPQLSKAFEVSNNRYAFVANVETNASYQYKFLNGDFWGTDEGVPGECGVDGNREATVGTSDVILDAFCFGTCGLCAPQTEVTFRVNLGLEGGGNPDGVSVAGSFQGWTPGATLMTDDDGDDIYEAVVLVDQGTYQFKFINGTAWGFDESVPGSCNVGGNREIVVGADPVTYEACFAQCTVDCVADPDAANITFRVDMNNETVGSEGVFVMGSFTTPAWQAGAIQMTDADTDGIYEATFEVSGTADIQFKFTNGDPNSPANEESGDFAAGGCGVSNGIGGFNRTHTRSGEPEVLPAFAFNSCLPLSTSEIELGEVSIYPNPSTGLSFISVSNPNGYTLRMNIVDVTGKLVRENVVLNSSFVEINTSDLAPGLYLLNIVNERSERGVYKLMVK